MSKVKININKKLAEERGRRYKKKLEKEINELSGREKIEYEINILRRRINNVKSDIKQFGETKVLKNKLLLLQSQYNNKKKLIENDRYTE